MTYEKVKNPNDALVYVTECTLATIEWMALKKNRPKHEYERQIEIAEKAILWIRQYDVSIEPGSRVYDVLITSTRTVTEWEKEFRQKHGVNK